ncbi:TPA: hypothetical protein SMI12_001069 [Serratia liquefaciens]|nr:hypothetical protein [Serratia liquefaciens]
MDTARSNTLRSTAKEALKEFYSPTNNLPYREILDKHARKIAYLWPQGAKCIPAWLRLNVECHRVKEGK